MAVGTTGDTLLSKVESAPRPFILLPDAHASGACPPGTALNVQLTLIGHSNRQLPYVLHALEQAAKRGLGTQRGRSRLEAVCQQARQGHWQPIYQPGAPLQPHPVTTPGNHTAYSPLPATGPGCCAHPPASAPSKPLRESRTV